MLKSAGDLSAEEVILDVAAPKVWREVDKPRLSYCMPKEGEQSL